MYVLETKVFWVGRSPFFVSPSCHKRILWTGWLKQWPFYLSLFQRLGSIRLRPCRCSGDPARAFFLPEDLLWISSYGRKTARKLWSAFYKVDATVQERCNLTITLPPKAPSSQYHCTGVRISKYKFKGNTNIKCMTVLLPHLGTESRNYLAQISFLIKKLVYIIHISAIIITFIKFSS